MKKIYLLIALQSLIFIKTNAQQFDWAKREGLNAYDYGYGVATDNSGNVYVAGKYEEVNAAFSGTTIPCAGNHDMYLVKYTSSGTLTWIRTAGGTLGDYAHAMTCDKNNFVYVAGEIEGYNTSISFPGSAVTLNSVGDNDYFLAKYDLNGTLIWAKSDGYLKSEKALGITYDASGNVFICGYFTDETRVNGNMISGKGGRDIYVAKYDKDGNFQWIKTAGSSGRDEAEDIKCDAAGNVYICGKVSKDAQFGSTSVTTYKGTSYMDAFLAKYSTDGTLLWVKTGGGDYDDVAWSMTMDNQGMIYIGGEYNAYAEFGGTDKNVTTKGNADVFVAAYDANGNGMWVRSAGGTLIDRARGLGTDGTRIYLTGQFGASASFGTINLLATDSSDVFMACLSNSGTYLWALSAGGTADAVEPLGYESGNAICGEASGNVYATGAILNGGVFGSNNLAPYSRTDVFVSKITFDAGNVGIAESRSLKNNNLYPNPTNGSFVVDLHGLSGHPVEISIYNTLGQLVTTRQATSPVVSFNLSESQSGVYVMELKSENNLVSRQKFVLQK